MYVLHMLIPHVGTVCPECLKSGATVRLCTDTAAPDATPYRCEAGAHLLAELPAVEPETESSAPPSRSNGDNELEAQDQPQRADAAGVQEPDAGPRLVPSAADLEAAQVERARVHEYVAKVEDLARTLPPLPGEASPDSGAIGADPVAAAPQVEPEPIPPAAALVSPPPTGEIEPVLVQESDSKPAPAPLPLEVAKTVRAVAPRQEFSEAIPQPSVLAQMALWSELDRAGHVRLPGGDVLVLVRLSEVGATALEAEAHVQRQTVRRFLEGCLRNIGDAITAYGDR